jgi:hypothetical protein
MFLYWGRRGLTQFAIEAFNAALADPNLAATVSVSRQNERFETFAGYGQSLFAVDTFSVSSGALTQAWRIPLLHRNLTARLRRDGIEAVVELMPHVWSPSWLRPSAAGARYVTIAHDADTHPGDYRPKLPSDFSTGRQCHLTKC